MTKEEKHLWYDFFKLLPITVNRQKIIDNYIADFYIDTAKLVIELDGSQHYTEDGEAKDKKPSPRGEGAERSEADEGLTLPLAAELGGKQALPLISFDVTASLSY